MSNPPASPGFVNYQQLTADELNNAFNAKQDYPAVTQPSGTSDTTIATTAFVMAALGGTSVSPSTIPPLMDSGAVGLPGSASTYSRGDHVHPSDTSLAALAGAAFTGAVTVPTPTAGDSSQNVATTAYVMAALGGTSVLPSPTPPLMDSGMVGLPGLSPTYSRGDHVHPSDTSLAALAGAAFTGAVTVPTPAYGDSSTNVATTAFVAGAMSGGAFINVNSLISTPFVGDGVTDNTPAATQLQQVLTSIGTTFPVAVTINAGVVTLVAYSAANSQNHWWKPNQRFTFSVSAGGSLPAGINTVTPYFITSANLTATSFTFSTVNNYNASQVEGTPIVTTGTGSGTFYVNLTGRSWINLLWPPGAYLGTTSTPKANSNGLTRIRHYCYGAVFDGNAGYFGCIFGPASAPTWVPYYTSDLVKTTQTFNNALPPNTVTLLTPANAANYYVGQWVAIQACNIMDQLGLQTSGPPSNHYMEYNKISAINVATGQITFFWAFKWIYLSTLPNLITSYGGGAAQISPMHPSWDMEVEIHGAEYANSMEFWCREIKFIDCVVQGYMYEPGNIGPSQSRSVIYKNCRFGPAPYAGGQIDKMLEYVEFDSCIGGGLQIASTSCIELVIRNCREDAHNTSYFGGTTRRVKVTDSILNSIRLGNTDSGTTDYAYLQNNQIIGFTIPARDDDQGYWGPQNDVTMVTAWSFNAATGTFTRNFTSVQQSLMWIVLGGKVFFNDAQGVHQNMGMPFEILNLTMDALGNVSFDTTLKALPPPNPSSPVTISVGSPAVVTWNAHGLAANTCVVFQTYAPGGTANPVFATAGAMSFATATTITPALPPSRTNGNLLVSWCRAANSTPTLSLATTGWTVFTNVSSGGSVVAVAYAYVTGSEAAPVWSASASTNLQSWTMQYSNTAPSNPIGAIQNAGGSTSGIPVGPLITTQPNSLMASMVMSDTPTTVTTPALTTTNRYTSRATNAGASNYALWSDKAYPYVGSSTGALICFSGVGTYSQVLFEILPAASMPVGLNSSTRYFVVNPSTNTFNVAATSGGAPINTTGTTAGTITCYVNPLHFRPHPCARLTCIANSGNQNLMDMNGQIDEPMYSRAKRGFAGRVYNGNPALYGPAPIVWGYLDPTRGLVVNVLKAATAGTLQIAAAGVNQTTWAFSNLAETIDLTQTGRRVVTNITTSGAVGVDNLTPYADWLSGAVPTVTPLPPSSSWAANINFLFLNVPAADHPIITVEIYTDQGIHRFPVISGMPPAGTAPWMWADSTVIAQYGATP